MALFWKIILLLLFFTGEISSRRGGRKKRIDYDQYLRYSALYKQFYCQTSSGDFMEAGERILVLSPGNTYMDFGFESTSKDVPSYKIHSFPLVYSGLRSGDCYAVTELPESFDTREVLTNLLWLKTRCFDHIVIYFNQNETHFTEQARFFSHFHELFIDAFGKDVLDSTIIVTQGFRC